MEKSKVPKNVVLADTLALGVRVIGAWPFYQNFFTHYFIWIFMTISLIFQYWEIANTQELKTLPDNMAPSVTETMALVKMIIIWKNRKFVKKCLKAMNNDWENRTSEDHAVMVDRARVCRRFYYVLSFLYHGTVLSFIPVVMSTYQFGNDVETIAKRKFVFAVTIPLDLKTTPAYEINFVLQIMQGLLTSYGNAIAEGLIIYMVYHVCGQLIILRRRIIEFDGSVGTVADLVITHNEIIDFAKNLDMIFTEISLVQMLSSAILISTIGFMLIVSIKESYYTQLAKYFIYILTMLMEPFIYCFIGEYLNGQSQSVCVAAYQCPWYDMNMRNKKMLMFVMTRAQKSLKLTAGGFLDLSLESYTDILRVSGSYLSVLNAMY